MPAMTTTTKCFCFVASVILILLVAAGFLRFSNRPTRQVAFSCIGVSNSSNITLISIGVTNQTSCTIVYCACSPQVKSNGVWTNFQFPLGEPMALLTPGQFGTVVVTTTLLSGESRVPVLWGFNYSTTATKWQEIKEDAIWRLARRNPCGRGALYTNNLTEIRR